MVPWKKRAPNHYKYHFPNSKQANHTQEYETWRVELEENI